MFIVIQFLFGYQFQIKAFTLIAPFLTLFAILTFYIIITKIKNNSAIYFVIGSSVYAILANITFLDILTHFTPFWTKKRIFLSKIYFFIL